MSIKYQEKRFTEIELIIETDLILLITATNTETNALHDVLQFIPDFDGIVKSKKDNSTYYFGLLGKYLVAHVECGDMGSTSSMGSTITVSNAINNLKPKFVLMVGIAFGTDKTKQSIGDVLISKTIIPYEIQRVGNQLEYRGAKPEASNYLRDCFKNIRDWEYSLPKEKKAKFEICDIFSGEKLIDNTDFRQNLQRNFPTAKGGEMEGAGVYAACQDKKVEWVIVKSICDFADGQKKVGKTAKQNLAINVALNLCQHLFNQEYVFEDLDVKSYENQKKTPKAKANNENSTISIFKNQLRNIEKYINDFKPQTALNEIDILKTQIQLTKHTETNDLLAKCCFLEAKARMILGESSKISDDLYKKANDLVNKLEYKERIPFILFKNGLENEALENANVVLQEDTINPRAWAIKDYLDKFESPISIRKNETYKSLALSILLFKQGNNLIAADFFDDFFYDDLQQELLPTEITVQNINYWVHYAQYSFQRFANNFYNQETFLKASKNNPHLKYANQLFKLIVSKIDSSEIKNNQFFNLARFNEFLTTFIITEDKSFAFKLYDEFLLSKIKNEYSYLQQYIILSLYSIGETDKVLNLVNQFQENEVIPEAYSTCALICRKRNDILNVKRYFTLYLKNVSQVGEHNVIHVIGGLEELFRNQTPVSELIEIVEKVKLFENEEYKQLVLASIYRFSAEYDDETLKILLVLTQSQLIKSIPLKRIIALCFFAIKETKKAKKYIDTFWSEVDISIESPELALYIEILTIAVHQKWANVIDSKTLFELWSHWRKSYFTPNEKYIRNELQSLFLSKNYDIAEEVARFGFEHFEDKNYYHFRMIEAICSQTNSDESKRSEILNEDLLKIDFTVEQKLKIFQYFFEIKKFSLGAELLYQTVKNNNSTYKRTSDENQRLRLFYNFNSYFLGNEIEKAFTNPNIVEIDCYVKYKIEDKEYFEQITNENEHKWPFSRLLGKKLTEEFYDIDFATGERNKIKILDIFNKYIGLKVEIYSEIQEGRHYDGVKVLKAKFHDDESLDIEHFEKQLKEIGGVRGTKNQLYWKELLDKYQKLETGFLELALFGDNPVEIYNFLRFGNYLPVLPIFRHSQHNILDDTRYVLDFTSLLLLFNLSKENIIDLENNKFKLFIPPSLYEYLKDKFYENANDNSEKFSVNITLDSISPNFHIQEYEEQKIKEFQMFFKWVKQYCEVITLDENLPFLIELSKSTELQNASKLFKISVESILLSLNPKNILISDDFTVIKKISNLTSCEYFLSNILKINSSSVIDKMLSWNYRGLTITGENLKYLFLKDPLMNDHKSSFQKALAYSLTSWNPNPNNLKEVLIFILFIYETEYDITYKQFVSRLAFNTIIKHNYLDIKESTEFIIDYLDKKLALQQYYKECILTDFFSLINE
jgi:nucleoside phosphorylase